jgi:membrane protein implicated in regulation of membrane protease activity
VNDEWALIAKGFIVAGLGAAASMLYIVALSAAYVGRYPLAFVMTIAGIVLAWLFKRLLAPYLDALDERTSAAVLSEDGKNQSPSGAKRL